MYADKAEAIFTRGNNCAQAVFAAFADDLNLGEDTALRIASSLGGGLGHSGEVCGAVLGMLLTYGMKHGYTVPDMDVKNAHSQRVKAMVDAFRAEFGATGCDDLRVVGDRGPCIAFVRRAAEMAAEAE